MGLSSGVGDLDRGANEIDHVSGAIGNGVDVELVDAIGVEHCLVDDGDVDGARCALLFAEFVLEHEDVEVAEPVVGGESDDAIRHDVDEFANVSLGAYVDLGAVMVDRDIAEAHREVSIGVGQRAGRRRDWRQRGQCAGTGDFVVATVDGEQRPDRVDKVRPVFSAVVVSGDLRGDVADLGANVDDVGVGAGVDLGVAEDLVDVEDVGTCAAGHRGRTFVG